jgi:hypothetical protein
MKHITAVAATILLALLVQLARTEPGVAIATSSTGGIRSATYRLVDSAPSIEILLQRVLDALAASDAKALRRLRVTEVEYREFIIPGSVKEGEQPTVLGVEDSTFYWQMLNTKSVYKEAALLKGFGGRTWTLKAVEYAKGHAQYAWYDAYRTTVLTVVDDAGEENELVLGSIAHVDGQYKFVGLNGDR